MSQSHVCESHSEYYKKQKKKSLFKVILLWMSLGGSKHITLNLFRHPLCRSTPSDNKSSSSCRRQHFPIRFFGGRKSYSFLQLLFFFCAWQVITVKITWATSTTNGRNKLKLYWFKLNCSPTWNSHETRRLRFTRRSS